MTGRFFSLRRRAERSNRDGCIETTYSGQGFTIDSRAPQPAGDLATVQESRGLPSGYKNKKGG